jgi:AcrR family transcriptional regulator
MPPRTASTRADFVAAAITFVDEHGLAALTLRSLGDALKLNHTALYRHFKDKDDLLVAMIETVITDIVSIELSPRAKPRARLLQLLRHCRASLLQHPELAGAIVAVSTTLPTAHRFTAMVCSELEAMGLRGSTVPETYQMLEGYVMGSTIFDVAGTPQHLEQRRVRLRLLGHPLFDEVSRTTADVEALNERAFERGLAALIDGCVASL